MSNTQILDEAAHWLVTLRDSAVEGSARAEFAAWLSRSPEHVRAYLELTEVWTEVGAIDARRTPEAQALIAQARSIGNVVELSKLNATDRELGADRPRPGSGETADVRHSPRIQHRHSRSWLAAAAVATVMLVSAGWWHAHRFPVYEAGIGEQRSITLADGSRLELNSRSRVRIRYSSNERRVDLLEGQGLFRVEKDAARPFVVRSEDARVRAVGTQFDVYRKQEGTVVTVLEGRVEVTMASGPIAALRSNVVQTDQQRAQELAGRSGVVELGAGEQVRVAQNEIAELKQSNPAVATAWTERRLVFEASPLLEVAQEFNRYNVRPLIINDVQLEGTRISGVFSSTDPASLLHFLREQPEFVVQETPAEIHISRRE